MVILVFFHQKKFNLDESDLLKSRRIDLKKKRHDSTSKLVGGGFVGFVPFLLWCSIVLQSKIFVLQAI